MRTAQNYLLYQFHFHPHVNHQQFPPLCRANANAHLLEQRTTAFLEHRPTKKNISDSTLAEVFEKKATDICKGDLLRIEAYLKSFDDNDPRTIFSCPRCSHAPSEIPVSVQKCQLCTDPPLCTTKIFLDFTIVDGSTEYPLQAYPKATEKLLNIDASTFHNMLPQPFPREKDHFMTEALHSLQNKKIPFIIGPNASRMEDYRELQWELKYIGRD